MGFQDLGGKDDFPTRKLELFFLKKGNIVLQNPAFIYFVADSKPMFSGIIEEKKRDEEDDDYLEGKRTSVRTSVHTDSDSD